MARPKKEISPEEQVKKEIEKQQKKLAKVKQSYENETAELQRLCDKQQKLLEEKLIEAARKSDRPYESIMEFLNSSANVMDCYINEHFNSGRFNEIAIGLMLMVQDNYGSIGEILDTTSANDARDYLRQNDRYEELKKYLSNTYY